MTGRIYVVFLNRQRITQYIIVRIIIVSPCFKECSQRKSASSVLQIVSDLHNYFSIEIYIRDLLYMTNRHENKSDSKRYIVCKCTASSRTRLRMLSPNIFKRVRKWWSSEDTLYGWLAPHMYLYIFSLTVIFGWKGNLQDINYHWNTYFQNKTLRWLLLSCTDANQCKNGTWFYCASSDVGCANRRGFCVS